MGNRSKEQQAFFATQQRRLLDQIQQRMSAKESQHEATFRDKSSIDGTTAEQTSRPFLRTTLRDTPKSGKSVKIAQKEESESGLQKDKRNFKRKDMQHKEQAATGGQEQQNYRTPSPIDSDDDLQLNAPLPKTSVTNVEGLSELLFSYEHLDYIIQDSILYTRLTEFLARYQPNLIPIVLHHMEIRKATKALEYANAVAGSLGSFPGDSGSQPIQAAAAMNKDLEERRQRVIDILMSEALPAQINFSLIDVVTNAMQKAIRGAQHTAIMRNLIGGLSEVFTLTDPSIEDNPIIYASEEFYNMTGYGRDFVIGRNCRFLQGPKTSRHSIRRLKTNIDNGIELSETLLNYRRDGTPFMNLLLVAPLHDNKGRIKYYIGAQVDVTGLVEEGQGLEVFTEFLGSRKNQNGLKGRGLRHTENSLPLQKLAELSKMFDVAENAVIRTHSRSNSLTRDSGYGSGNWTTKSTTLNRRLVFEDSTSDEEEAGKSQALENESEWRLAPPGAPTGILPGVYQKYLLLRPAPSLKVIFVSPALQQLSKLSKKGFLECIESSRGTMEGLKEAFKTGMPVSAKVSFETQAFYNENRNKSKPKRDTWVSATPMFGSDDSIGVWIVVVVQDVKIAKDSSIQKPSATLGLNVKQPLERTKRRSIFANEEKETNVSDTRIINPQQRYSQISTASEQPKVENTPARLKSTPGSSPSMTPRASIANGTNTAPNRNYSHSLSQSIPFTYSGRSTPNEDYANDEHTLLGTEISPPNLVHNTDVGNVYPESRRKLPALQDNEGISRRTNSRGEANGEGRVRIKYNSGDEDEDSGVDTVEEDDKAPDGRDGKGTLQQKGDIIETWSPPSKGIWTKPPRPSLPNRMTSVD